MHDLSFLKRLSDNIRAPFRKPAEAEQNKATGTQHAPRSLLDVIRAPFRRPAGDGQGGTAETQHLSAPRHLLDSIRTLFRRPAGEEPRKATETHQLAAPRSLFDVIRTPFWRLAEEELAMPVHRFVAVWIALTGYASITEPMGRIAGRSLREIDVLYHLDKGSTARILAFLEEHGLVADGAIAELKVPRGFQAYDVCTDPFWLLVEDELGLPVDMSVALWTAFQGYAERGEPYGRIADRALREIDLLYRLDRGTAARILAFLEGHGLVNDGTVARMTKNSRTAGTRGRKDSAGRMDGTAQESRTAAADLDGLQSRVAEDGDGADSRGETGIGVEAAAGLARAGDAADSMTASEAGSMSEVDAGGEAARLATAEDKDGSATRAETGAGVEAAASPADAGDTANSMTATGAGEGETSTLANAGTASEAGSMSEVDAGGEAAHLANAEDKDGTGARAETGTGVEAAASLARAGDAADGTTSIGAGEGETSTLANAGTASEAGSMSEVDAGGEAAHLANAEDRDGSATRAETGAGVEAAASPADAGDTASSMTATGAGEGETSTLATAGTTGEAGSMSEVSAGGEAAHLATAEDRDGADSRAESNAGNGESVSLAASLDGTALAAETDDHEAAVAAASPAAWSVTRTGVPHTGRDHARPNSLHR